MFPLAALLLLGLAQDYEEDFENRLALNVIYDGWEQVQDADHPPYNDVSLERDPAGAKSGNYYVRLRTLGGNTSFRQTPVHAWPADPSRSYRLTAFVRIEEARSNFAYLTFRWLDRRREPVREDRSAGVSVAADWTPISLAVTRPPVGAHGLSVGLHFVGKDVRGRCSFDHLKLASRPRVELSPQGRRRPAFPPGAPIRFTVAVPGLPPGGHEVELVARDAGGAEAARTAPRPLAAGLPVTMELRPLERGYYEVETLVRRGDTVAVRDAAPVIVADEFRPRKPFVGGSFNLWKAEYPAAADVALLAGLVDVRVTVWERPTDARPRSPSAGEIGELFRDLLRVDPEGVAAALAWPGEEEFHELAVRYREYVTRWEIGGDEARGLAERVLRGVDRFQRVAAPEKPLEVPPDAGELLRRLVRHAAGGGAPVHVPVEDLLDADGRPTASLLAVRAANEFLGGASAQSQGTLFPPPVGNVLFGHPERGPVLVLWSPEATHVTLGAAAEIHSPLGGVRKHRAGDPLRIGPTPLFVVGAEPGILDFYRSVRFEDETLPLRLDPSVRRLRVQNPYPDAEMTRVELRIEDPLPDGWRVSPREMTARSLAPGQEVSWPVSLQLPRDEGGGVRALRLRLSFVKSGAATDLALSRTLTLASALEVDIRPEGDRVDVRIANRAGRAVRLLARVRFPDRPERAEPLALPPDGVRRLEYAAEGSAEVEVLCEEVGGERLRVRRSVRLRP